MSPDDNLHLRRSVVRRRPAREAFVLFAITLVTLAVGVGFYVQAGWSLWGATMAGLAAYLLLAAGHALVRRFESIRELSDEIERLEDELARITRAAAPAPAFRQSAGPRQPLFVPPQPTLDVQMPAVRPLADAPSLSATAASAAQGESARPMTPPGSSEAPAREMAADTQPCLEPAAASPRPERESSPALRPGALKMPATTGAPPAPEPPQSSANPMARFWSFRPVKPAASLPGLQPTGHEAPSDLPGSTKVLAENGTPANALGGIPAGTPAAESDVEQISGMIRRFVTELAPAQPAPELPQHVDPEPRPTPQQAAGLDEASIAASVGALRAAASEMRRQSAERSGKDIERGILPQLDATSDAKGPLPPPVGAGPTRLAVIADAITSDRLDVCLEPVVSLADRKTRHYEISLLMRGDPPERMTAEDLRVARGTGMLPLVDAVCTSRAASVARFMDDRGTAGSLFATISAESLTSERFLGELAEACRGWPRLPERLILCFRQSDALVFTPQHLATLKQLSSARFRFAASDLESFEPDTVELRKTGFMFLRIGARHLADGLACSLEAQPITGAEIMRRLAGTGMTIIATGIENDEQAAQLLAAGIPLGQGPLFGAPRLLKTHLTQPARGVAA